MKMHGQAVQYQSMTTKRSHVCVSQQHCWHNMIEAEWEDMKIKNPACNIFTYFPHYFQFNLDETSLRCNAAKLKVLGRKIDPDTKKIAVAQGFQ